MRRDRNENCDPGASGVHNTPGAMAVNAVCPVSGRAVDAGAPTRRYGGRTVGFCCEMCPATRDKKTVAERDAMMAKVAAE